MGSICSSSKDDEDNKPNLYQDEEEPAAQTNSNEPAKKVYEPIILKKTYKIYSNYAENMEKRDTYEETQGLKDLLKSHRLDPDDQFDIYDENGKLINIKIDQPFKDVFGDKEEVSLKIKPTGLPIARNPKEYIIKNTSLIGSLTFESNNKIGLYIFDISLRNLTYYEYSLDLYPQLKKVNQLSACCNAKDFLYISGGENQTNAFNSFVKIDLSTPKLDRLITVDLPDLKVKRARHSMIYIPENFIYIVGGVGTQTVEFLDLAKGEIYKDSELNVERCEPSLILVNDKYLYTICGFVLYEDFITSIERCNLHRRNRTWEVINYNVVGKERFIPTFFGVGYLGNNIILISEKQKKEDNKFNYFLHIDDEGNHTIEYKGRINSTSTILFNEKLFIPFNATESINIPCQTGKTVFYLLNNENGNINEVSYE